MHFAVVFRRGVKTDIKMSNVQHGGKCLSPNDCKSKGRIGSKKFRKGNRRFSKLKN